MSEMIDRVSRAVRLVPDAPGWTYSERVARAAIAAMAPPTVGMIEAARLAVFHHTHPGKQITDVAWVPPSVGLVKAMLTAALQEAV